MKGLRVNGEWHRTVRYDTGVKATFWAHLFVERQGSGGLAFIHDETEEGRLAGLMRTGPGYGRTGQDRTGQEEEGVGMWSGCTAIMPA